MTFEYDDRYSLTPDGDGMLWLIFSYKFMHEFCFSGFSETSPQLNPWWAVDLGKPLELTSLVVYNRKSTCCST